MFKIIETMSDRLLGLVVPHGQAEAQVCLPPVVVGQCGNHDCPQAPPPARGMRVMECCRGVCRYYNVCC